MNWSCRGKGKNTQHVWLRRTNSNSAQDLSCCLVCFWMMRKVIEWNCLFIAQKKTVPQNHGSSSSISPLSSVRVMFHLVFPYKIHLIFSTACEVFWDAPFLVRHHGEVMASCHNICYLRQVHWQKKGTVFFCLIPKKEKKNIENELTEWAETCSWWLRRHFKYLILLVRWTWHEVSRSTATQEASGMYVLNLSLSDCLEKPHFSKSLSHGVCFSRCLCM